MLKHAITKILLFTLFFYSGLQAQFSWDMERKNLQVLADTISADQLSKEMRAFSVSLGVRCHYCHDDSRGKKLSEIDFASDSKPQKKIAREMLKMTRTINKQFISNVRKIDDSAIGISCMTCHHGYKEPKHLSQVLMEEYGQNGLDAALNKYETLKARYYGGFAFDFREGSLNNFGYQVMASNVPDAMVIFKLNAGIYPESANVYDSLGEAYLKLNDKVNAKINYQKSLKLNPKNKNALKVLKSLEEN